MKTAVDTNILLDLVNGDPAFGEVSSSALYDAIAAGVVAICPIVYAELSVAFLPDTDGLDRFLRQLNIRVDAFTHDALQRAATAWAAYLQKRGTRVQCPRCGEQFTATCPACAQTVTWRQRVMPDFLVGAHATLQADRLLTRDPRRYGTYFPELRLDPPSEPTGQEP